MNTGYFYQSHPLTKLLLAAVISFSCFILTFIAAIIMAIPIFGIGPPELINALEDLTNPENLNLLKYLQIAQSTGLFLIPPFIIAYLFSGNTLNYLKLLKAPMFLPSLIALLMIFSSLPVIAFLTQINQGLHLPEWLSPVEDWMRRAEDSAEKLTEAFLLMDSAGDLLLNLLMIAVIPALGEELLFRGVVQKVFSDWTKNIHLGIFLAAALFSFLHFQFYGFLPRTLLGILFGYLFVYSGSLWYPILAHFFNNAMAVIIYYYIGKEGVEKSFEQFGKESLSFYFIVAGTLVLLLLMRYFRSNFRQA